MSIADKLQTIAENEQRVFDAGKKAEYDAFWDSFQQNGNRTNYRYGFSGSGWVTETLKPKHVCTPTDAIGMFFLCGYQSGEGMVDFREIADKFDFSKVTDATQVFYSAGIDYITADFSSATSLSDTFNCGFISRTTTITLKVTPVTTNFNNTFHYAHALRNLTFTDDSEIACGGLNLKDSPNLTKESIISVINALSDNTTDLTVTFSQTAVNNAFTAEEWNALKATKQNWSIDLA